MNYSRIIFSSIKGRINLFAIILFIGVNCFSCNSSENKGRLLAKVNEKELYQSDLDFLFKSDYYNYKDSAKIVSNYIDEWVESQILVCTAEQDSLIDFDLIERKALEFKNALLIHELENIKISEALDTIVEESEIKAYYESHEDEFELNDYLVKVLYLKVPLDAPEIEKIGTAYQLRKDNDLETIELYAKKYASNFYYDIDGWIYFDDLLKEIPLHDINKDRFILKRSKLRFEENGFYYFLNIVDYKLKNSISPLSFERENIKVRILNTRVKKRRESIKNEIIKKAYEREEVSIY